MAWRRIRTSGPSFKSLTLETPSFQKTLNKRGCIYNYTQFYKSIHVYCALLCTVDIKRLLTPVKMAGFYDEDKS